MTRNSRRPVIGSFPNLGRLPGVRAPAGRPRQDYQFSHLDHQSPAGSQMHGRHPCGLDPIGRCRRGLRVTRRDFAHQFLCPPQALAHPRQRVEGDRGGLSGWRRLCLRQADDAPQLKTYLLHLGAVSLQAHGHIIGLVEHHRRRGTFPGRLVQHVQVDLASS